jgi:acyl-CoA synthetase (AMP-forming)/AMP-acid ligase II
LAGTEAPALDPAGLSMSDYMMIIYTSGTTGDPKGVKLRGNRFAGYAGLGQVIWGYTPQDKLYTGLSLTHGNAQAVTLGPSLALSIPCVISRRFTKSRIWDVCRAHGCTTYSLLGGMMMGIYSEPVRPDDGDNPVRVVISAGTPRPIWESFEKRFNVKIHEWYAAVEGGFAHNPPGVGPIGSFGKPIPGSMEIKVVREDDTECEVGEVGELICRPVGGRAEVEYHGNQAASEAKTRGGWLRSGDMVHRDAEGWLYFDYRKGGGLRRQGDFILPEYVEKVLADHPKVTDVCVYGVPAASGSPGESDLVAAVVPVEGRPPDIQGIFDACRAGLERNSVPSYLQVVAEIPKSASLKNLDRLLKLEFKADAPNVFRVEDYPEKRRG